MSLGWTIILNRDPRSNVGGCQNYGPFLGSLNIRCRIRIGTQKGTIILTTTHVESHNFSKFVEKLRSSREALVACTHTHTCMHDCTHTYGYIRSCIYVHMYRCHTRVLHFLHGRDLEGLVVVRSP